MEDNKIMKELNAPFKPNEIEWRVGATNADKTKGIALAYVTNRAIQKRLDDVVGIFGWKNEFQTWKDNKQLCGISIYFEGEWITKWDGADDTDKEATKGGLSGAMKRAACQWGIGRYLYDIPNQWVKIKKQGKSYVLAETPKLPNWALPKGCKPQTTWEVEETENKLPKTVQDCIKAFESLSISQADLENYLHNEASMFDDKNIADLRAIYSQLKRGLKDKEDYFEMPVYEDKRKELTKQLQGV